MGYYSSHSEPFQFSIIIVMLEQLYVDHLYLWCDLSPDYKISQQYNSSFAKNHALITEFLLLKACPADQSVIDLTERFCVKAFLYKLVSDRLPKHHNIISNDLEQIKMSFRHTQANI